MRATAEPGDHWGFADVVCSCKQQRIQLRRRSAQSACALQLADDGQLRRSIAIGQETVVTNSHQRIGQHMRQKAADELVDRQCLELLAVAVTAVTIAKRDMSITASEQSFVTDRHPMRIPAQVVQQPGRAREGRR